MVYKSEVFMKKNFFSLSLILFIFCSFNLFALNFPKKADKIEDFIPKGWKMNKIKLKIKKFFFIKTSDLYTTLV